MELKNKTSLELLTQLKNLVKTEKEYTFQILNYLKEIESRKLYLSHGCSSLFSFCTVFLEYSEPEAMNRIQAMRLMKSVAEAEMQIKTGALSLTAAAHIQTAFRKEDKLRKENGLISLNLTEKIKVIQTTKSKSVRECQKALVSFFPESFVKQEKIKAISKDQTKIEVVISDTLMNKLNKIKNLTAHKNYNGSMEKLLEIMADVTLDKLDKFNNLERVEKTVEVVKLVKIDKPLIINKPQIRAIKVTDQNKSSQNISKDNKSRYSLDNKSRYIPRSLKYFILNRDKSSCQYIDPLSHKKCESKYAIEVDHIFPYSKGGMTKESNLQLLCAQHNKLKKDLIYNL